MKLNIGCGGRVKEGFINIDSYQRPNVDLDYVLDVKKGLPFESKSVEYIYAEHFLEHLDWLEGKHFLMECHRVLKKGGILRLVVPDYERIFAEYVKKNWDYFEVFFNELNESDYDYYSNVFYNPEEVKEKSKTNPPPEWHFTDKKRVAKRVRRYGSLIEIVDWFVHQYGEHECLYDFESLDYITWELGFSHVERTDVKPLDSHAPTRITSSLHVEVIK